MRTPEGTLVVTVNQPDAEISVDGSRITLKSPDDEPVEVEVVEGEHTLKVTKGGFQTHTQTFSIASRGREVFNVKLVPQPPVVAKAESGKPKADTPELPTASPRDAPLAEHDPAAWKVLLPAGAPAAAIAPFDAFTAKKHQEAWADYLGQPVEEDVDLGGGVKLTMVLIPAGEFTMGSPEDDPDRVSDETPHRIQITEPFYLGIYEVTQEQYEKVMGKNPSGSEGPTLPVEQVSWEDATTFCAKLSASDPRSTYRLPTEAEWEYACRAGTTTRHSFGDDLDPQYAWFRDNSNGRSHPVGQKQPNAWGLYDMHGNVREWCRDWYASSYQEDPSTVDPTGPATGSNRVARGGGWFVTPEYCRSANRDKYAPINRFINLGFRVALVPGE